MSRSKVIIVDTSWRMHSNFHSKSKLSVTRPPLIPGGVPKVVPTGHVYGTVFEAHQLAGIFDKVIFAVDSPPETRKKLDSGYKSGRSKSGYNLYSDLVNILGMVTSIPNVYYVKKPDFEADDLICSFIHATTQEEPLFDLTVFMHDTDILQQEGNYDWVTQFRRGYPIVRSRSEYLEQKYGVPLDHLPIWWKVVRGNSHNAGEIGYPRFPSKYLKPLCEDLAHTSKWEDFEAYLKKIGTSKLPRLDERWEQMKLNYDIISPYIEPVDDLPLYKREIPRDELLRILTHYELNSLIPFYEGFL